MYNATRILIVEDNPNDYDLARREIQKSMDVCEFKRVETEEEYLAALDSFRPDIILSDYYLPSFDGMKAVKLAKEYLRFTPVIIWTGSMSEDVAVDCMMGGAANYVLKENIKRLGTAIVHALKERQLLLENEQTERRFQSIYENSPLGIFQSTPQGQFVHVNPAMARIYGYNSPEEMMKSVSNIASQMYLKPEERRTFTQLLETQGTVENFEWKNFRKDGSVFWTSTSARVVRDPDGTILYYEGFLQDITARKETDERLVESEKRFRALIANGMENISLLAEDGTLLWEDPSTNIVLGYERGRFVGKNIFQLVHPDDLDSVNELFSKVIREHGGVQESMFRLKHQDGSWHWIEATATNMLDESSVKAIVINYRDVTGRREAEDKLRDSEERYRLLFEDSPLPMWIFDHETFRFLKVNEAAIKHYGYSMDEFKAMTIKDIRPSEDIPRLLESIERTHKSAEPVDRAGMWRHLKKDGSLMYVEIVSHLVEFAGRKAELVLVTDITKRYKAELEIQKRNDDLALINALNEVISQGQGLDAIVSLMRKELKRTINSESVAIYLLSPDGKSLRMQQYLFPPEISAKLEQLIGHPIPAIEIPIQAGGYFEEVLRSQQGRITSDPATIQKWMEEFAETSFLPRMARGPIRKLIPNIFKLLNIKSTILTPLVWEGRTIGLLDVSSPGVFSEEDLQRIENICAQLTIAIRRHQTEELLQEERNLLRTLIDNVPDRIYAMDSEGRKTLSNTADWKASGGKTMEDVIGKTDFETYPRELAELFWKLDKEVLDTGKPVINYEEPGLDSDGNPVSILTTKIPLRNEEGKIIGLVGVGRDITERKQSEARISDLLVFNEKILTNSPVGILTYKLSGDCTFANEKAASIIGTNVAALRAQNFHNIESWKKSGLYALVEKAITSNTFAMEDIHLVSTFGREVWLAAHCITFSLNEEEHLLLSISDITERKLAEEELRQKNDDLWLLNVVNNAVVRGQDLNSIIHLLTNELKRIFSAVGSTIYTLSADKRSITMEQYAFAPETERKIEKLIGFRIPKIEIPVKEGGHFYNALLTKQSALTTDPQKIRDWIAEFAETRSLHPVARAAVRKLMPHIYTLLNIRSTIIVPLISQDDVIGFLDVSGANLFTSNDLKRIETIGEQLTSLLQRQQAIDKVHKSEKFLQGIQNSLSAHIAILDEHGTIIQVNEAWRDFGDQNGLQSSEYCIGTNYFAVCESARGLDEQVATETAAAIRQVLSGERGEASVEYACHSPTEKRWFTVHITCFDDGKQKWVILAHENITERVNAELAFMESTAQFRTLFEASPDAIMLIDPEQDWTIIDCNSAAAKMNGYTREELIGKPVEILNPEPSTRETNREYLERIKSTEVLRYETTHIHKDGTPLAIEVCTTLIQLGDRSMVLGIDRDITQRKRAEEELRRSEARYRTVVENQTEFIVRWKPDGTRTFVNDTYCRYFGITLDQALQSGFMPLVVEEDRQAVEEKVSRLLSGSSSTETEIHRVIKPDGSIGWQEWTDQAIYDNNGQLVEFQSVGRDITERKHAENELRRSEERFRQLATNIEEAFWITDVQANREVYISPAAATIWGKPVEYFMQSPDAFIESIMDEDLPLVNASLERQRKGEKTEMEYRVKRADGSIRWVWDRAFPIFDASGKVIRLAGIAADITQRKQSEMEIQRHLTELEALYENGLTIGRLLEPTEIGNQIIQTFARHLSWHHVAIRLLNAETDKLELIAFNQPDLSDEARAEIESRFNRMVSNVGQGLSGWAMQTGMSIRTGNVHTHPRYVDTHQGIMSGLYMPLKVGNRIIGCISVESDVSDAFTQQDERLLATLANQASIAFENARLYQAAQLEISERRRAQEALWQSETHYRQLADSITDILFELDQDLHYTHWNKASEMFSGIPAEDAIGRSMQDLFGSSESQLERESIYRSVLRDRQARSFETQVFTKGQKRYLEINAYPSARGVSVVAKDITERRLAEILMQKRFELMEFAGRHVLEEVLQRTIDEMSSLTESHIGFLHFVDDDQNTIRFQTWSSETRQLMRGVDEQGMHYPLDSAGVWADAVRQRQPVIHNNYESLLNKKGLPDGHIPVLREMVVPIIRNDKIVAVLGVGNKSQEYTSHDIELVERFADYAWDITERKQMESALAEERNQLARRVEERTADLSRANSNLARALRVKDEFLANMSHELRTPLNAILGLSESLGEQVAGPLNEKQQKYLSTINESGHHLLSLINDILDLAKIEAGQISLDINKVDVNGVCQASLRMIKQLAQRKNQEVSFSIEPNIGLMWADERRLKQMIVNLLSNAVKFTPDSSALGLEVRGDKEGNKISISVWDQGIGISSNDLQRLFKPFVQLDSGLAREAAGTGLGLALVSQMAKLHGGSVTVESELGQGSRFTIMLPWEPALAGESNSRLRTTGKFRAIKPNEVRPTILLVEDTQEVVMMLVDYLEMAGFNMVTAQDGIDGLTQAKIAHPDLILMDIQMPRMDGFETTKKLRSDPEFKETPIIALTALAMPNDRQRCLDAGMNEYLSKPVNLKALAKTIKAFLYEAETNQS